MKMCKIKAANIFNEQFLKHLFNYDTYNSLKFGPTQENKSKNTFAMYSRVYRRNCRISMQ